MESPNPRLKPRHAIGIVARRTGLRADLIRAWERRYSVVEPARSETRRRLYSDVQVDRLRLLRRAVDAGRNIGDVAGLSDGELEELIAEDLSQSGSGDRAHGPVPDLAVGEQPHDGGAVGGALHGSTASPGENCPASGTRLDTVLAACEERIRQLDQHGLMIELERASVVLSRTCVLEHLIGPLLERVGHAWRQGRLRPVQEHMASAVIRSFVGGLVASGAVVGAAPRLVVATPLGQSHEIGALLVAASAAAEGWQALYLGAEMPAAEIAAGASATRARAVALSIIYPPDDSGLGGELAAIGRLLPVGVELLVGGREAPSYRSAVEAAGGRLVSDLGTLRRYLATLRGA